MVIRNGASTNSTSLISNREVDSLDYVQYWILWIHDPKRLFTTDPKIVNTATSNSKQF